MNVGQETRSTSDSGISGNAVAGPSSIPMSAPTDEQPPPIFFPPPAHPLPQTHLRATQDLLKRFQLLPMYDKYVRPYTSVSPDTPTSPSAKGKERELPQEQPQSAEGQDGEEDSENAKKMKNSYKHLIKNVPGKHSMKKDDYLTNLMMIPPKEPLPIFEFDGRTQHDAFAVSPEGLKGWNVNSLIVESAQAREDRKRRKELKKQARAQMSTPTPGPVSTAAPTPAPTGTATPKPHLPAIITAPTPGSTPRGVSTPTPRTASVTQLPTPSPVPPDPNKRGKKREHEDEVPLPSTPKLAKVAAGLPGMRPRPVKKQRTDLPGQNMMIQQPTPQGV